MGPRKIRIGTSVSERITAIAVYIAEQGLINTAKKFINDVYDLFASLSDKRITHRPCGFPAWRQQNYRCATFRKKYSVAYLDLPEDIIISDFAVTKFLVSRF